MAKLEISILDMVSGQMAEGVEVQLRKVVNGDWQQLPDAKTAKGGHAVLCAGADLDGGGYFEVLVFLGKYFDQRGYGLPQIKLVDIVPLRFGIESGSADINIRMTSSTKGYNAGFATEPAHAEA